MTQPIDTVRWIPRTLVRPNAYNPNAQLDSAHLMLIESIQDSGWTSAIVVRPDPDADGRFLIVDGEHRWRAAEALGFDSVPIVLLDANPTEAIAATVKHNRARGAHGIKETLALIHTLRADGATDEQIEYHLGLAPEERQRLETSEDAFMALMAGSDRSMKP